MAGKRTHRRWTTGLFWSALALAVLGFWLWPTGLRETRTAWRLDDGTAYEAVFYCRWRGPPPPRGKRPGLERELLDPTVIIPRVYDFSPWRRGWTGMLRHNAGVLWDDTVDTAVAAWATVRSATELPERLRIAWRNDCNFDLIGIDIHRNGRRLVLADDVRQRIYAAMAWHIDRWRAWDDWGVGYFAFTYADLVHCDGAADGEWLIIGGLFLRCEDGRLEHVAGNIP